MVEQQEKKLKLEISTGSFWLLINLPNILAVMTIILGLFADLIEYGIIAFIAPLIIIGLNLVVIIIVVATRMMNKRIEKRLSEEIEVKNYEMYSKKFYIDWRKVTKMVYSGKIEDKVCAVCKLPLHEKELILQYPNCQALFHAPHLIEWLGNDDACPVCVSKLIIT